MAAERTIESNEEAQSLEFLFKPECILLFSGKRKSGKDFITNILHERLGDKRSVIIKISGPIKTHWAKSLNLDIERLLGDGEYKEKYRLEMVKWSENIRKKDYGYFCRASIDMYHGQYAQNRIKTYGVLAKEKPIWIVSDIRRKTDIKWFEEYFGIACTRIRITSSEEIRKKRGWNFIKGIDDAETECDLDDVETWDMEIQNDDESIEDSLKKLISLIP